MNINDTAFFGEGKGDILIQNVNCKGTESSFLDCGKDDVTVQNCSHHYDVGVKCNLFSKCFLLTIWYDTIIFKTSDFNIVFYRNLRPYVYVCSYAKPQVPLFVWLMVHTNGRVLLSCMMVVLGRGFVHRTGIPQKHKLFAVV